MCQRFLNVFFFLIYLEAFSSGELKGKMKIEGDAVPWKIFIKQLTNLPLFHFSARAGQLCLKGQCPLSLCFE